MIAGDIIGLSLRNLRQAKLRTALTTLGVSIGIASLAGMVSLGVGLQDQVAMAKSVFLFGIAKLQQREWHGR